MLHAPAPALAQPPFSPPGERAAQQVSVPGDCRRTGPEVLLPKSPVSKLGAKSFSSVGRCVRKAPGQSVGGGGGRWPRLPLGVVSKAARVGDLLGTDSPAFLVCILRRILAVGVVRFVGEASKDLLVASVSPEHRLR